VLCFPGMQSSCITSSAYAPRCRPFFFVCFIIRLVRRRRLASYHIISYTVLLHGTGRIVVASHKNLLPGGVVSPAGSRRVGRGRSESAAFAFGFGFRPRVASRGQQARDRASRHAGRPRFSVCCRHESVCPKQRHQRTVRRKHRSALLARAACSPLFFSFFLIGGYWFPCNDFCLCALTPPAADWHGSFPLVPSRGRCHLCECEHGFVVIAHANDFVLHRLRAV
jgi:hypothetical protein